MKKLNTQGHFHFIIAAIIIILGFSVFGVYKIVSSSALERQGVVSIQSEQGCWLAGRIWTEDGNKSRCTNTCRSNMPTAVTDKKRAYCKGNVVFSFTQQRCVNELHRYYISELDACARKLSQNDGRDQRYCLPGYPYYNADFVNRDADEKTKTDVCEKNKTKAVSNEQSGTLGSPIKTGGNNTPNTPNTPNSPNTPNPGSNNPGNSGNNNGGQGTPQAGASQLDIVTFNYAHFKPAAGVSKAVQSLIVDKGADVIGLQEFGPADHRKALSDTVKSCKECNLGIYMPNSSNSGSVPIVWNKANVSLVSSGSRKAYDPRRAEDGAGGPNVTGKYVNWVVLQDKATGKEFVLINTHMIPTVDANGRPNKKNPIRLSLYEKHMKVVVEVAERYKLKGITPFITGDFNVDYRGDSKNKSAFFPYQALGKIGVWANWRSAGVPSAKQGTHSDSARLIDYVFSQKGASGIRILNTNVLASEGSDHLPVMASYEFKR